MSIRSSTKSPEYSLAKTETVENTHFKSILSITWNEDVAMDTRLIILGYTIMHTYTQQLYTTYYTLKGIFLSLSLLMVNALDCGSLYNDFKDERSYKYKCNGIEATRIFAHPTFFISWCLIYKLQVKILDAFSHK